MVNKKPIQKKFIAYKMLAALLYPNRQDWIGVTAWDERLFYQKSFAQYCNTTPTEIRNQLEYLRQAGFLTSIEHGTEAKTKRLMSRITLIMPTGISKQKEL